MCTHHLVRRACGELTPPGTTNTNAALKRMAPCKSRQRRPKNATHETCEGLVPPSFEAAMQSGWRGLSRHSSAAFELAPTPGQQGGKVTERVHAGGGGGGVHRGR